MLTFIAAIYNELDELPGLFGHVYKYVDAIRIVDDGSTDDSAGWLDWMFLNNFYGIDFLYDTIEHTGLPETVKAKAVSMVTPGSWVLMLDADERFEEGGLEKICEWLAEEPPENVTHVYFTKDEYIDGVFQRSFQKCHLFRSDAVTFSDLIHVDDAYVGDPVNIGVKVIHRKSSHKQRTREQEYLLTYKKLLDEGKIDQGKFDWLRNLHYFEKDLDSVESVVVD